MTFSATLSQLYQALLQSRGQPMATLEGLGLTVETCPGTEEKTIKTTLRHRSGEWCSDEITVLGDSKDVTTFSLMYICDFLLLAGAHVGAI